MKDHERNSAGIAIKKRVKVKRFPQIDNEMMQRHFPTVIKRNEALTEMERTVSWIS